jgi:hypothetical protein
MQYDCMKMHKHLMGEWSSSFIVRMFKELNNKIKIIIIYTYLKSFCAPGPTRRMGADRLLIDIRHTKKHIIINRSLLSFVVVVDPNRRPTHADNVHKIIK